MNPIIVLIRKELRVEFRSLQGIVASAMLSFMILMSFKFSMTLESTFEGSGVLWASILLTGLGLITHISTRESERGTFELLKISPISRYQLFLGRMAGSLFLLSILGTIITILYVIYLFVMILHGTFKIELPPRITMKFPLQPLSTHMLLPEKPKFFLFVQVVFDSCSFSVTSATFPPAAQDLYLYSQLSH